MRCQLPIIVALFISQACGNSHSSRFEDFLAKVQAPFYDALLNFEVVANLTVQLKAKLNPACADDPLFPYAYESGYDLEDYTDPVNSLPEFSGEEPPGLHTNEPKASVSAKQLLDTLPLIGYAINATHASLTSATAISESHRKQYADTIATTLVQINNVERDITQKSREISTLNSEKRALQDLVHNLRNDVHREQRNLDHARSELHKHERELKKRKKEKKIWIWVTVFFPPAGFGLIPNAKDIDRAKSRIRNAEAVLRRVEQSFHGAQSRLSHTEARIRSVEQSLHTAQTKQRDLEKQLNNLNMELKSIAQFEAKLKTLYPFLNKFTTQVEHIVEMNLLGDAFEPYLIVFDELRELLNENRKQTALILPSTRVLDTIRLVLSAADKSDNCTVQKNRKIIDVLQQF